MGRYDFSCNTSMELLSTDGYKDVVRIHCYWKNNGWKYHMNGIYGWVTCNGEERCIYENGYPDFQSDNNGQYELGYSDFTIWRGQSDKTWEYHARLRSDSSYASGERTSGSGYYTTGALAHHTVSYNANGGTGAPGSQTKWYGTVLTLSGIKPTRTGHSFQGWNGNGTTYQPGGTYGSDSDCTMYAIWKANTYTVSYNANGGTGAPGNQTKTYGQNLTLSSAKPTKNGYNFKGWATSSTGNVLYQPGGIYSNNNAITLYAIWELAYTLPQIQNLSIQRSDSTGTASESGTYLVLNFNWSTYQTGVYVKVLYKDSSATSYTTETLVSNSSSKTGSITKKTIGNNGISVEKTYNVKIIVYDSKSNGNDQYVSTSNEITIGSQNFPIDIKNGGTGVAIGKVAETSNLFDVNWDANFRKSLVAQKVNIYGGENTHPSQWKYIGECDLGGQSHTCILDCYTGAGQNGNASQNTHFKIILKEGWDGGNIPTIGVTTVFLQNYQPSYRVCIYQDTKHHCRIYMFMPFNYTDITIFANGSYNSININISDYGTTAPSFNRESTYYNSAEHSSAFIRWDRQSINITTGWADYEPGTLTTKWTNIKGTRLSVSGNYIVIGESVTKVKITVACEAFRRDIAVGDKVLRMKIISGSTITTHDVLYTTQCGVWSGGGEGSRIVNVKAGDKICASIVSAGTGSLEHLGVSLMVEDIS